MNIATLRATKAIIRCDNLRHNYRQLRASLPKDVHICAVVKANGYGHGIIETSRVLVSEGVDALAVACLSEAWTLHEVGVRVPIHLLGLCLPEEIPYAVQCGVIPFVSSVHEVELWESAASRHGKIVQVHVALDTGMSRIGCNLDNLQNLIREIETSENLQLVGLATHFARADDEDTSPTEHQIFVFQQARAMLGKKIKTIHAANSAGLLRYPHGHFNMVRPGLLLYGYSPFGPGVKSTGLDLRPVLELVSRVLFLKRVPAGTPVSYGGQYVTTKPTYIATVPLGYADGYARSLGGKAQVVIREKKYPIVGSICMDQLMIDVGDERSVELYDEVSFFGDNQGMITAGDVAEQMGSITYEVLTSLGLRIPRIYQD